LHLLAMLWTSNQATGWFILEKKAGLWVLPLIVVTGPRLAAKHVRQGLLGFALACTAGTLYVLLRGLVHWGQTGDTEWLFYHAMANGIGMHAIYFSAFLVLSIFIIINHFRTVPSVLTLWQKTGIVLWLSLLLLALVLLASKTILVVFFLLGNGLLLIGSAMRQGQWKGGGLWLILNALLVTLLVAIPQTRARFQDIIDTEMATVRQTDYRYDTKLNGLSLRLVIWKLGSGTLTAEQAWWTGLGAGDVQDQLDAVYRDVGLYTGNPALGDRGYLGYNAHNQYLQNVLQVGIAGLVLWLLVLGWLLWRAWRSRSWLLAALVMLFGAFGMTEAVLETHHGSVAFALMASLLVVGVQASGTIAPTGFSSPSGDNF
ncbi:MAG: O-antigen ligase family protein, partial [Bacteroidota bacterium]